jgi:hypothetical protein
LDVNDHHLDFMSAMTTTCVGGEIFSHVHTFRISADCEVLLGMDWFEVYKKFRERLGSSTLRVESLQMEVCPISACRSLSMLPSLC